MATALAASAAGLAAGFSVQKVAEYADGYTRFTNALKIAGLEGSNLTSVQEKLFQSAQKYGAPLEALGTLYGRTAQSGKALGASQNDLLKFTDAVAASIKVQGVSAEEAKGALLQLSQALGTGVVHAQDYNSVADQLRPLLQAAADASEKYRGNVAAIKNDVNDQKLASADLFRLVLAGYDGLQKKAGAASLTIAASLQTLNNALGKYIGETDEGLSATDRFGIGIKVLADNLGTVLPALTAIAIGFGVTKAAGLGFNAVAGVLAHVAEADQALARQVLLGNAQFIDRTANAAASAIAVQEAAAAEVSSIEATIVARRAEQEVLRESIAETQALAASKRAEAALAANSNIANGGINLAAANKARAVAENDAAFASQRLAAMRTRQAAVDVELIAAEESLAAATATSATATEAATVATAAATIGARAAATSTALFAGALELVSGALPIIAIAAVVAAIMYFRSEAERATEQTKAFAERHREAATVLGQTAIFATSAAGAITQVGTNAAAATGKMAAFAGKVGEAAEQLRQLAIQQRDTALGKLQIVGNSASATIREASYRIRERNSQVRGRGDTLDFSLTDERPAENAKDQAAITKARADLAEARRQYQAIAGRPLEKNLSASALTGGRDIKGDLAQARNDLKIAQAGGDKTEINRLKATVYELTQYQAYRKAGASDDSAKARSSADAQRLRDAGQGKIDAGDAKRNAAAGARADRAAAAAARKGAAEVKDEANDTRAYKAAERAANDKIAQSNAELTNSTAARAQIERDRIEADRISKNEEIAQQGKAGHYNDERVRNLQKLNDQAAKAATNVVDVKERRQNDQDGLSLYGRQNEIDRDRLANYEQLGLTVAQRRTTELQLLALAKEEERRKIAAVLAKDSGASEGDRAIATLDQNTLDERYASKGAVLASQNEGPFDQYRRKLKVSTADTKSALEQLKVNGLQGLEDGLVGLLNGTESVASAFKKMASSIISDLARIAIEKGIFSLIGAPFGLSVGGRIPGKATGGRISGAGTGTSDSILAMIDGKEPLAVSNGESIVTAEATAKWWPLIDAMNKGKLRGRAAGGRVGPSVGSIFQPAAPDMRSIGEAQRANRTTREILYVQIDKSDLFDAHVQRAAAPLAQVAMVGGSAMAQQEYADDRSRSIP
ncbi:tape measure protein [Sphingomonas sp. PAMC 26605]|uniref:tape measure protein n=1 Tax=Sphingomonas sp. PAMC 26605 TaxID=1112214 RepID=UPI001E585BEE|nr:tape measure protein [Sphingomonas sp. PAMC 26605]